MRNCLALLLVEGIKAHILSPFIGLRCALIRYLGVVVWKASAFAISWDAPCTQFLYGMLIRSVPLKSAKCLCYVEIVQRLVMTVSNLICFQLPLDCQNSIDADAVIDKINPLKVRV